jgi:predicted acyl esterase
MASAFDPRIKAVVAMSAWADLVASLYGDYTRRPQAAHLLQIAAQLFGTASPDLTTSLQEYFANQNLDPMIAWGKVRSASTYLSAINRNHPAIMIANSYGDSLFPPNEIIDFYGQLTGPKRLELAPGDHIVAEAGGLFGLPNHVWDSAYRWFDQYIGGINTQINTEPPVVLRHLGSDAVEQYPDWAHVTGSTKRFNLGAADWTGTGPMSTASANSTWTDTITAGTDTTAGAGVALLTNAFTTLSGAPPTDWLPSVNRANGVVWESDALPTGASIRGMPALRLGLKSGPSTGTLVAYLYDTDALGVGRLITNAPVTWLSPTSTVNLRFQATAYDIPAGHHLALVIDTADGLYAGASQNGAQMTFTGPASIDLPVK